MLPIIELGMRAVVAYPMPEIVLVIRDVPRYAVRRELMLVTRSDVQLVVRSMDVLLTVILDSCLALPLFMLALTFVMQAPMLFFLALRTTAATAALMVAW